MQNTFINMGDTTAITVRWKGINLLTIVDTEDVELIKSYSNRWYAHYSPSNRGFYIWGYNNKRVQLRLHRLITNAPDGLDVDHDNRNTLDNRKRNLKVVTRQDNILNRGINKNNKSGVNGVFWSKQLNKWCAQITINRKCLHLGYFDDIEEAKKTRMIAEELRNE